MLYGLGVLHVLMFVRRWQKGGKPIFLMGHRVLQSISDRKLDPAGWFALQAGQAISVQELKRRLKFLRWFLRVGDPGDLVSRVAEDKSFYLSFDDGYLDNLTNAAPVLEEQGIRAVVFLVAGLLRKPDSVPWWDEPDAGEAGTSRAQTVDRYARACIDRKKKTRGLWRDADAGYKAPRQGERRYINEEEVTMAAGRGVFYFGNHTVSHPNLMNLNETELGEEINGCHDYLKRFPGYLPVFAYPFGFRDEGVKQFLKSNTKMVCAFATGSGSDADRYDIRRINLNTRPYPLFMAECLGVFNVIESMRRK